MDHNNALSRQALDELLLAARSVTSVSEFDARFYTDMPVAKRKQLNTHLKPELYEEVYSFKSSEEGLRQWGACAWILLLYVYRRVSEFYPVPGDPGEEEVRNLGMAAVDFYVSHLGDILSGSPGISREERQQFDKQVMDLKDAAEGLRSALEEERGEVARLQAELAELREDRESWRAEAQEWRGQVGKKDEQLLKALSILEK